MSDLLKVKIVAHTPNPEEVIAQSAKLCYSKVGVDEIMKKMTSEKIDEFLARLVSIGHESPFEHVSFTFAIEGVSRSLSHQLVRHRLASYSQQSQRYVKEDSNFEFITPRIIEFMGDDAVEEYENDMKNIHNMYLKWQNNIKEFVTDVNYPTYGMNAEKVANENARYILPNACETKLVMTMNARELLHFFEKRCCNRAQEEIRGLANEMLRLCKEVAPTLFKYAGAPCVKGKCMEGNMSCKQPYPRVDK